MKIFSLIIAVWLGLNALLLGYVFLGFYIIPKMKKSKGGNITTFDINNQERGNLK